MATVPSSVKKTSEGFVLSSTSRSLQSNSLICACGARKPRPRARKARTSDGVNRPTGPGATAGSCASFQSRSHDRPVLNDKYSAPAENLAPRGLSHVQSCHELSSSGSSSAASKPNRYSGFTCSSRACFQRASRRSRFASFRSSDRSLSLRIFRHRRQHSANSFNSISPSEFTSNDLNCSSKKLPNNLSGKPGKAASISTIANLWF
mmetsp:Transcript_8779/g.25082  ORF Transcript_8779/g.25082 Transcript_8779/m.25082 type:complete len:206 (-) Transcript_8779:1157-1774(-)